MADFILRQGDIVMFMPAFSPAIVAVKPGQLAASSKNVRINGKPVCLAKDSENVKVAGCMYTSAVFTLPGSGTLSIAKLAGNQVSNKVRCNNKPLMLKGLQFQAKFKVLSQAKTPPIPTMSPIPDTVPSYLGFGSLLASQLTVRAA
jgi:hypothetical protein